MASVFAPKRALRLPTTGMTNAAGIRNETMNQTERYGVPPTSPLT